MLLVLRVPDAYGSHSRSGLAKLVVLVARSPGSDGSHHPVVLHEALAPGAGATADPPSRDCQRR